MRTRGHPAAIAAVSRAIASERPPHALLLVGPRGSGKTTLALDLAAGLLCTAADPAARPCRACATCRRVDHGNHPDVHLVAPEGAGEQVRLAQIGALIGDLALLPMEGARRVAIVTGAHRMNPDAQNALLKTLEEPVGAATIVLCADDQAPLLPTVVSRVARLRLGPVALPVLESLIVERGLADAPRARVAALASGGLPGIAFGIAANPETTLVADRLVGQLLDLVRASRRARLDAVPTLLADGAALDALLRGALDVADGPGGVADGDEAGDAGDTTPAQVARSSTARRSTTARSAGMSAPASRRPQPAERRRAAARVLEIWRGVARDLAVAGGGGRAQLRNLGALEEIERDAPLVDRQALVAFIDRLEGLAAAIEAYANPELVMDHLALRWPGPARRAA